jgi:hypothetical protein
MVIKIRLVGISHSRHAAHDTENVVVNGIHTDLSSGSSRNGRGRKDKLENSVIDSGEVARPAGLVFLRSQCERIHVDTGIRGTSVVLEGLDNVEIRTFALREAVLAVKLELSSDSRILTPAVEVKSGLSKNECSGIRESGCGGSSELRLERSIGLDTGTLAGVPGTLVDVSGSDGSIQSSRHLEKTRRGDEGLRALCLGRSTEGVDSIGESINTICVVERLSSEHLVEELGRIKRRAVVNVGIRLDNPDELLDRVVEVELDLVGRRTNRLITSELNLLNQILVRVLCHLAALVSVEEDVVNIERGSNEGLLVSSCDSLRTGGGGCDVVDGPEALTDRADVKVNLDLVVLESNKGKSKTRVAVEPELKRNVEGGLRESSARSTHLGRDTGGSARTSNIGECRINQVCKLGGVTDELEVSALLLRGHCDLVPDVHPVTILAVNALTSNLDLDLRDELLTNEIEPTGIDSRASDGGSHRLVNLRKSNLEVCAVGKITISGDCAGNTSAEISLSGECLLDRLHSEVGMASVRHLPESNLRGSSKENVLCAVGD